LDPGGLSAVVSFQFNVFLSFSMVKVCGDVAPGNPLFSSFWQGVFVFLLIGWFLPNHSNRDAVPGSASLFHVFFLSPLSTLHVDSLFSFFLFWVLSSPSFWVFQGKVNLFFGLIAPRCLFLDL